jgi:Holliday junction resolvase RusA-like endonuclease
MNNEPESIWPPSFIGAFLVKGEPVAMGRPRFTRNGRVYTPKKTEEAVNHIASVAAEMIPYRDCEEMFDISIQFRFKRPKRLKEGTAVRKATKPDIDNLIKTVLDGINRSGIWTDDNQVVSIRASKFYCASDEEPCTSVFIYQVRHDTLPF